jgi:hypothetical protein
MSRGRASVYPAPCQSATSDPIVPTADRPVDTTLVPSQSRHVCPGRTRRPCRICDQGHVPQNRNDATFFRPTAVNRVKPYEGEDGRHIRDRTRCRTTPSFGAHEASDDWRTTLKLKRSCQRHRSQIAFLDQPSWRPCDTHRASWRPYGSVYQPSSSCSCVVQTGSPR